MSALTDEEIIDAIMKRMIRQVLYQEKKESEDSEEPPARRVTRSQVATKKQEVRKFRKRCSLSMSRQLKLCYCTFQTRTFVKHNNFEFNNNKTKTFCIFKRKRQFHSFIPVSTDKVS